MWQRNLTSFLGALVLAASACDDPAPVVLGRLERRTRDAASDAHHEEEAEHRAESDEPREAEHDEDEASESERE